MIWAGVKELRGDNVRVVVVATTGLRFLFPKMGLNLSSLCLIQVPQQVKQSSHMTSSSTPSICPRELKTDIPPKLRAQMFTAALFITAKRLKQSKYPQLMT